jgi:predicted NBD/HSP70 family sugar kinase
VASGAAVARQLAEQGWDAVTSRDVVRMVQDGNPDAVSAARQAGQLLGEVLATAVSLLNPSVLILGGDMALTHEHFLLGLRETLYQRTQPLATRSLTVARSRLGDQASVQGIAAMVHDEVFSPTSIDAVIGRLESR